MSDVIAQLHRAAAAADVTVERRSPHEFHLTGRVVVAYYPLSTRRTAFIVGVVAGRTHVTPERAVQMALELPPLLPAELRMSRHRKAARRELKRRLFERDPHCHWCRQPMQILNPDADDYGTIEHVIPLARGGMDHGKNRVLAHKKCNQQRGHDMPELTFGMEKCE